jgi:hypothetical protein
MNEWFKFPASIRFKKGTEEILATVDCYYCPDRQIRIASHPELADRSILIDAIGTTDVPLSFEKLGEVFRVKGESA